MSKPIALALAQTLELLVTLRREGIRPAEAHARLRALRQRLGLDMDLLWEEEVYDGSIHYDVLFHQPEEGTVSLSWCADTALPWPMRGVQRWADSSLARVNGTVLKVDQAIACLDFIWDEVAITERLVNVCLIQEELEREPIELTGEELQQALDAFRRERRLFTTAQTQRWMEQRGLTHEQLERLVGDEAVIDRLRDRLTADRVEEYFAEHRADFDTAALARIDFVEEEQARRVAAQIDAGILSFHDAAERCFLEAPRRGDGRVGPTFTTLSRRQASAELCEAVFAATPGWLVGPVRMGAGYALLRVLELRPGRLDEQTRESIKELLFERWLAERRAEAKVEWAWGTAALTGSV